MQAEQIKLERIETYTASLPGAIQGANGAQFAMLLSLITTNQEMPSQFSVPTEQVQRAEPSVPAYPTELEVNKPQLVERLNNAVHQLRFGDFAFVNSFIETQAQTVRPSQTAVDQFEKVALMSSGKLMLDHIDVARGSLNIAA